MAKLIWDAPSSGSYYAGVSHGVFYPKNGPGVAWNGLVSVQESPSETEGRPRYLDGKLIGRTQRRGEFSGSIEAFTYPDGFYESALIPRHPRPFGLSYRTETETSFELHIVYDVLLSPSSATYNQDDAQPFAWDFTTMPKVADQAQSTAHYVISAATAYPAALESLEAVLYGSESSAAKLPTPDELFNLFEEHAILRIIDNGDGSWTAIGPDDAITVNPDGSFEIDWVSAVWISEDTYTIRSH